MAEKFGPSYSEVMGGEIKKNLSYWRHSGSERYESALNELFTVAMLLKSKIQLAVANVYSLDPKTIVTNHSVISLANLERYTSEERRIRLIKIPPSIEARNGNAPYVLKATKFSDQPFILFKQFRYPFIGRFRADDIVSIVVK